MLYRFDIIKRQMEVTGKTVEAVAKEKNLSPQTISRARAGGNLSVKKLTDVVSAIDLEMKNIFDEQFELPSVPPEVDAREEAAAAGP